MYDYGTPLREIAHNVQVPAGSVSGILSRYGDQTKARNKTRPGRPKKLSERNKRHIMRCIESNPFIRNQDLLDQTEIRVTIETLSKYLSSEGIQHRRALRRPLLTPSAAARRLQFAQEHAEKPISWWRKVIWSDETSVRLYTDPRQPWVWTRQVCHGSA